MLTRQAALIVLHKKIGSNTCSLCINGTGKAYKFQQFFS
jgi:hypothetical protein